MGEGVVANLCRYDPKRYVSIARRGRGYTCIQLLVFQAKIKLGLQSPSGFYLLTFLQHTSNDRPYNDTKKFIQCYGWLLINGFY